VGMCRTLFVIIIYSVLCFVVFVAVYSGW